MPEHCGTEIGLSPSLVRILLYACVDVLGIGLGFTLYSRTGDLRQCVSDVERVWTLCFLYVYTSVLVSVN